MADRDRQTDEGVLTEEQTQTRRPRLYKVLLHNDDYTPMDFVVMILESIFHHPQPEAVHIMLSVHRRGVGLAGVFTREVAECKVSKVREVAAAHEFPLQCSMEPE